MLEDVFVGGPEVGGEFVVGGAESFDLVDEVFESLIVVVQNGGTIMGSTKFLY